MKLIPPQRQNALSTWHMIEVVGRKWLADFEVEPGVSKRFSRGFRMLCCVRGKEADACFERLDAVVWSYVAESLTPTDRSMVGMRYKGRANEAVGDELFAGIFVGELVLNSEMPVVSPLLHSFESLANRVAGVFQATRN